MTIIRWRPLADFDRFFEEVQSTYTHDLATDIYEENNTVIVEMNVSGVGPDKIDISVDNSTLRVSGSREEETETEDKQYYSKEIRRGEFERVIQLPCSVASDKASAEVTKGVLKIALPKLTPAGGQKIRVKG